MAFGSVSPGQTWPNHDNMRHLTVDNKTSGKDKLSRRSRFDAVGLNTPFLTITIIEIDKFKSWI